MKKLSSILVIMSFVFISHSAFAVTNARWWVQDNGSWTSGSSFSYTGSCGGNCNNYSMNDAPGTGIDGVQVMLVDTRSFLVWNWWYWDSDDSIWHNDCDMEIKATAQAAYNYYGREEEALNSDNITSKGLGFEYVLPNGGPTYNRMYYAD